MSLKHCKNDSAYSVRLFEIAVVLGIYSKGGDTVYYIHEVFAVKSEFDAGVVIRVEGTLKKTRKVPAAQTF